MNEEKILKELRFKAVRSSGSGGQHVNKVSTKVALYFSIANSIGLTEHQQSILKKNLASKISKENVLILVCDKTRSQHKNKELVIKRFFKLLQSSLKKKNVRKATKPTKASVLRISKNKLRNSLKKALRKKPRLG